MPVIPHRATTSRFLPGRWRAGPSARAIPPARRRRQRDMRVGERWSIGWGSRRNADGNPMNLPLRERRPARWSRSGPRPRWALRAVLGHTEHEATLGLSSGSEVHSREPPLLFNSGRSTKSVPFFCQTSSLKQSLVDKLSLSTSSPRIHRLIAYLTYYT
jgi:hypothetical protein